MNSLRYWIKLIEALNQERPAYGAIVEIHGTKVRVQWDAPKEADNKIDHDGLSLADGVTVVADDRSKLELDYDNRNRDERERYVGPNGDHILFVVCEWFETGEEFPVLQMISVRYATSHEANKYMNEDIEKPITQPKIDPDNPPLTGNEKWIPAGPHIKAKLAAFRERWLAKQNEG